MFVLLLVSAAALVPWRLRPVTAVEQFGAFTAYRSSLATMPAADRHKITQAPEGPASCFDGVVVPSARGAHHLSAAAITARNAGSCLVVLTSGRTDAAEAGTLLAGIGLARHEYLVLPFENFSRAAILPMRTSGHPLANTTGDLSQKRNAGLIIACILGWRSVLFVDDDVQPISRADLKDAAALLAGTDRGGVPRRLVGWAINEFRDFSAVGHARTHGTDARVSFAGGGAMAISCDPLPPFFPPVYNEDMLLWLEMLRHDPAAACVVGTTTQQEYDPYRDPQRAAAQEFGEVLVEGLLRTPRLSEVVSPGFWRSLLDERRAMLRELSAGLVERGVSDAARVVQVALDTHTGDWPDLLARFVADWGRDLELWRDALSSLPRTNQLGQAAVVLARLLGQRTRPDLDQAPDR
ncbi:hypothetical protein UK23_27110 [Lentzea aerocolonigenes]|uniref:Glycosyltransferase n=2 Tax=Lentzea aerocolonigenes TaxID=68170 RepID=A0A0F0GSW6_LENAE|nr:hypothetical protein UK23_27110 [Lentzea aerocolonigenes]